MPLSRDHYLLRILLTALLLGLTSANASAEVVDVRVVIDVSGSMKQNDPRNLRAPALRLLTGLLPDGGRSGVWTFGQYVNMQVRWASVDETWKRAARMESDKIHSRGLFTDIEAALRAAVADWTAADASSRRTLILLTDGVVDLPGGAAESQASRERILNELLPRVRQAGVTIHAIALSQNADRDLLRTLAVSTDGWYEEIEDADQLQRNFLRLFTKSTPVETIPLLENRFRVDESVQDMTVVVFRGAEVKPLRLRAPDGTEYRHDGHPEALRWHREEGYDMVTVAQPQAGEWSIDAEQDPDNRVMVVTDLKLATSEIPNNIMSGEALTISAHLLERGEVLSKPEFLKLTDFRLDQGLDPSLPASLPLNDDGTAPDTASGDAYYSAALRALADPGLYEVTVRVDAPTFARESRHPVKVHAIPATIDTDGCQPACQLNIRPDGELIELETLEIKVGLHDMPGIEFKAPRTGASLWTIDIPQQHAGGKVSVRFEGVLKSGRPLAAAMDYQLPPVPAPAPEASEPTTAVDDTVQPEPDVEPVKPADTGGPPVDWWQVFVVVLFVNLAIVGLGSGIWYWWYRSRKTRQASAEKPEQDDEQ